MWNTLKRLVKEEKGQGMAEYALILAAIAVICVVAYQFLGDAITGKVDSVTEGLGGATSE
jgi:pilus assembly protein Flp/PilA